MSGNNSVSLLNLYQQHHILETKDQKFNIRLRFLKNIFKKDFGLISKLYSMKDIIIALLLYELLSKSYCRLFH